MSKKFPGRLFVVRQDDGNDGHYFAGFGGEADAIEPSGQGGEVAIYKLDQVCEAEIVRTLTPKWPSEK